MGTPTTNYGWIKPTIDDDQDQWGVYLNQNLDSQDTTLWNIQGVANAALPASQAASTYLPLSGGTITGNLVVNSAVQASAGICGDSSGNPPKLFIDPPAADSSTMVPSTRWIGVNYLKLSGGVLTGPLTLVDDPTIALGASTKQYVDNKASTTTPIMDGVAAVGVSATFARADHVHPTDTSRAPIASPTFTGTVTAPTGVFGGMTFGAGGVISNLATVNSGGAAVTFGGTVTSNGGFYGASGGAASLGISGGYVQFIWSGAASSMNYRINNTAPAQPWLLSSSTFCYSNIASGTGGPSNFAGYIYGSSSQNLCWWYMDGASDERIKENIRPTNVDALNALLQLDVDQFDYNAEVTEAYHRSDPHVPIGLVAQKVQALMPEAVGSMPEAVQDTNSPFPPGCLSLVDTAFTPYLIRAIQQLTARVAQLEAQLAAR